MLNIIHNELGGDKGPLLTITSFFFGSIFVNIQTSLSIISFSIAIVVGILTIIEKITALKKNKNK
jgi:hypothetical protein